MLNSLSFHTHIIELCLFLAVEKCSCLEIYNLFSGDTETVPIAQ